MHASRNIGLRLLCLSLGLLCLLLMILPVSAVLGSGEHTEASYTSKVHYRGSASTAVIGQFEDGRTLTVLGESGDFYQVDCYDMTGYIAKSQVRQENEKYYVSCDPNSDETLTIAYLTLSDALVFRAALLQTAQSRLGCRYVYGCMGPKYFDCSGFTTYVYAQNDVSIERTASTQLSNGVIVSREGLQVGDLVFFREPGCANLSSHVGMYAGEGKFIHADSRGVIYTDMDDAYYAKYFLCARRVLNVTAAQIEQVSAATADSVLASSRSMALR